MKETETDLNEAALNERIIAVNIDPGDDDSAPGLIRAVADGSRALHLMVRGLLVPAACREEADLELVEHIAAQVSVFADRLVDVSGKGRR